MRILYVSLRFPWVFLRMIRYRIENYVSKKDPLSCCDDASCFGSFSAGNGRR
jgi:hypothetical protein